MASKTCFEAGRVQVGPILALVAVASAWGCAGSSALPEVVAFDLVRSGEGSNGFQFAFEASNVSDGPVQIPIMRVSSSTWQAAMLEVGLGFGLKAEHTALPGMTVARSCGQQVSLATCEGVNVMHELGDVDIVLAPGEKWHYYLEATVSEMLRDNSMMYADIPYELTVEVTLQNADLEQAEARPGRSAPGRQWFGKARTQRKFTWQRGGTGFTVAPIQEPCERQADQEKAANPRVQQARPVGEEP